MIRGTLSQLYVPTSLFHSNLSNNFYFENLSIGFLNFSCDITFTNNAKTCHRTHYLALTINRSDVSRRHFAFNSAPKKRCLPQRISTPANRILSFTLIHSASIVGMGAGPSVNNSVDTGHASGETGTSADGNLLNEIKTVFQVSVRNCSFFGWFHLIHH